MEFSKGETQLCRISRGEALFCMEFLRDKVRNLEILKSFSKKCAINLLALFFFPGMTQFWGDS